MCGPLPAGKGAGFPFRDRTPARSLRMTSPSGVPAEAGGGGGWNGVNAHLNGVCAGTAETP